MVRTLHEFITLCVFYNSRYLHDRLKERRLTNTTRRNGDQKWLATLNTLKYDIHHLQIHVGVVKHLPWVAPTQGEGAQAT